jgi:hypothetical protein
MEIVNRNPIWHDKQLNGRGVIDLFLYHAI